MKSTKSTRTTVRPRRSLGRAWLAAALIGGVPLFGALYWLAAEAGDWRQVLVVQIVMIGAAALIWVRQTGAFAEVTDTTVTKQSFLFGRVVKLEDVTSIVMAETWRPGSSESRREMLLKDARGHSLLRFDGTFWSPSAMDAVAAGIGAPIITEDAPVTSKEFLAEHPGASYWYEGRLWLAIIAIVVAFGVAFFGMSWIMHAIGANSII